ncbi:MAG: putative addiction module antidote protein [bacterium]|nr:putative addiction module antidote protein [bacterium]
MKKIKGRDFVTLDEFIQKDFKDNPSQADLYLDESIKEYKQDRDQQMLIASLHDVVKAKGFCYIARKTGLNRQTIYRALSKNGNPTFNTLNTILEALGYGFDFIKIKAG